MMYWVYDLPNWLFGLMTVVTFVGFATAGLLLLRVYIGRRTKRTLVSNEIVNYYFAAIVGFYGITLGLISVGTWQTFSEADTKSTLEAAAIEALYRDLSS